ncbi:cryptochrome/photolyase family protein [Kordia sp. YSTF-M3]|uniref:Cryptochrome/photolyase family protein n=1 Tax=Kordia aestuariivivens TaxID=2759037 RepID=A0ABR7Q4D3_9FLAO|nr:cryptochrome/photolyase family protein [Kordia aestuariivivens]MBC8753417.1 cryptochrome/photolyase family protein [Kordia aestuariivivens]
MKTLRLLLGDQLNHKHSWYENTNDNIVYFMAEMKQETNYVKHHIQKVVAFFKSMRSFSDWLQSEKHQVVYYTLDDSQNQHDLVANLKQLIKEYNIEKFEYQLPDEYRLDEQLTDFCDELDIETEAFDTEHFLTSRTDFTQFFEGKKQMVMEYFYRDMRKKYDIMMLTEKNPEGGKWNFDQSNRKKWKGTPEIPAAKTIENSVAEIYEMIQKADIETIGSIDVENFDWTTNREDSLDLLDYFCSTLLVHFGDYQDAMHTEEHFLFHSRLSFAMNSKMLHPKEVIETVVSYWRSNKDTIEISQVEGFVRQILGWREYMRGMYWKQMPNYRTLNKLNNTNSLPNFYWTGNTKMNCLKHAITQSLEKSYAHHIQRLMITGNFALLAQVHPDAVDEWYLGIYIDAIEWVEITNTRGMSQFADGGLVATKPYVSSGSYINKMSNYCKGCAYKVSKKTEDDACPFNSLYWNFLDEKRTYLKDNQRMSMMFSLLDKMDETKLEALKNRAQAIIANPDDY